MDKQEEQVTKLADEKTEAVAGGWGFGKDDIDIQAEALGIEVKHHTFKADEYFYGGNKINKDQASVAVTKYNENVLALRQQMEMTRTMLGLPFIPAQLDADAIASAKNLALAAAGITAPMEEESIF